MDPRVGVRAPGGNMRRGVRFAGVVVGWACVGCGASDTPPVVQVFEVQGKVLLASGKPLTAGHVDFVPSGAPGLLASGTIGPDGGFRLTTGDSGAGAPPGDYRVRVEPHGPPPVVTSGARSRKGSKLPYPPRYLDEDGSGLKVTVRPETNRLQPFVLK